MTEDFSTTARRQPVIEVERRLASDEAFRCAAGEDFLSTGEQELALLRALGLHDGHLVIEVGCGAGRLAYQLAPFPHVAYFGSDVSLDLIRTAGELTDSPNVRFALTDGATIEHDGARADFVCFFSIFEHLHYEDIFKYFVAASTRLKPGGLLVMTFFEFRVDSHWKSFVAGVESASDHLNQFIDRDAIAAWATHSGFDVVRVAAGGAGRSLAVLQKQRKHQAADEYPLEPPTSAKSAFPLRMANTSCRILVGEGEHAFVQGLVLRGAGTRCLLLRAVGPSLKQFNVTQPVADPELTIYDARGAVIASGRGWDPALARVFALVGAFDLAAGSGDAAFIITLSEGTYSLSVSAAQIGVALVEIYELPD